MTFSKQIFFLVFLLFIFSCAGDSTKKESTQVQDSANSVISDSIKNGKNENLTYAEAYDLAMKLWDIPFEEKNLKTNYGTAHVTIAGPVNGKPLILLHGMNASSTMWYPNVKALSQQYRIYAIDFLLEPGKSTCVRDVNNTSEIVDWYYEIFDQLQLKNFGVVGASRGGWLAMSIALRNPQRINKIVLLSPAQAFTWIKPKMDVIENMIYSADPKRKKLRNVLETMTVNVDKLKQEFINQYYISTTEANTNKCILQMRPFSEKELSTLKMPVLVVIGDHDIINNDKSLKLARKSLPNVEADEIKNAGHFLSFDQPELIDKKILDFIAKK